MKAAVFTLRCLVCRTAVAGSAADVIGVAVISMRVNILYSTAAWLTKEKVRLLPLLSKAA